MHECVVASSVSVISVTDQMTLLLNYLCNSIAIVISMTKVYKPMECMNECRWSTARIPFVVGLTFFNVV